MDTATGLTPLLIDAKREYVGQLTDVLAPYVINHIQSLYLAAAQQHRNAPTLAFQRKLREIPQWNSNSIQLHTTEIQNRYSFLGDLIAACFVAYVKILSSVKLHQQKPNIRLRLPANDTFVHKVYINVAREFYTNPALIRADKTAKLAVVRTAVETSVRDMLPIEDILKAYLGNTVDAADHTMNPAEMSEELDQNESDFDQFQLQGQQQQPMMAAAPQVVAMQPGGIVQTVPQVAMVATQPAQPVMFAPQQQMVQQPIVAGDFQPSAQQQPGIVQPQQQQVIGGGDSAVQQQQQQQPSLFGAADDDSAPKQISISAPGQSQPMGPPPQQDLFSDAEDEF